ncbi:hypothetical protein G6F57_019982 [Rhizopus arrhizus]|nr:hypothetical protein G6F57_019982 [Rhizopus arrhizus]
MAVDVEAILLHPRAGNLLGDERSAAGCGNTVQNRVALIGRRLILEVEPGEGVHQHAAHVKDHINVGSRTGGNRSWLDRTNHEPVAILGACSDTAEAFESASYRVIVAGNVLPRGVGLQGLDDGVVHGGSAAVVDRARDDDVLARHAGFRRIGGEQAFQIKVVLLRTEAICEERAYRLGGSLLQLAHDYSVGVWRAPRSTMSNS